MLFKIQFIHVQLRMWAQELKKKIFFLLCYFPKFLPDPRTLFPDVSIVGFLARKLGCYLTCFAALLTSHDYTCIWDPLIIEAIENRALGLSKSNFPYSLTLKYILSLALQSFNFFWMCFKEVILLRAYTFLFWIKTCTLYGNKQRKQIVGTIVLGKYLVLRNFL